MYYYSDSPARDFAAWDAEQSEWLRSRPVCSECEQHIQDEDLYFIHGLVLCPECVDGARMSTDNFS